MIINPNLPRIKSEASTHVPDYRDAGAWSKGAFSKLCESKKGCGGTCLPKLSDL